MARCASCGTRSAVHYNDCAYFTHTRATAAMAPVAASSVSDVVSDVGTCGAVHGASQAVCYRELMTQLRTCDPTVRWCGAGGLLARAADEIDERRGEVVALEADNARLRDDNQRLRDGVWAFVAGYYPNPRTLAKGLTTYKCPHGAFRFDDCGQCNDDYLAGLLK